MTGLDDAAIAARTAAARQQGVAAGLRDAALEIGGRLAMALLTEDREALIAGEGVRDRHGSIVMGDGGTVRMDSEDARERLAAYDAAISHLSRAFGPLQQDLDRAAAAYRAQLDLCGNRQATADAR